MSDTTIHTMLCPTCQSSQPITQNCGSYMILACGHRDDRDEKPIKTRTITLTDRPPVTIREDQWPMYAEASYHDKERGYEGQYNFQSHQDWRGGTYVRMHADGRAIVYAVCAYETAYPIESGYSQRAGVLLPAECTTEDIIAAIHRVHGLIDIVDVGHRDMWRVLAAECIADLPAEELS